MKQKYYLIIAAVIIILAGGYWLLTRGNNASAPETANTNESEQSQTNKNSNANTSQTNTASNQLGTSTSAVAISAQIAGNYVTVDNFYLQTAGFIVIYEAADDGGAGKVVGQSGVLSGTGQDLEIKATVQAGKKYLAMIHVDNGDKKFNGTTDVAAVGPNNTRIAVSFQVSN